MKKFMMVAAAVLGISWMGLGATAEAGGPHGYGYGHGHYGRSASWGYGVPYRPPVYRAPVYVPPPAYGVPVYSGYPVAAPVYPYYNGYRGTSFGISTPSFGLYIR